MGDEADVRTGENEERSEEVARRLVRGGVSDDVELGAAGNRDDGPPSALTMVSVKDVMVSFETWHRIKSSWVSRVFRTIAEIRCAPPRSPIGLKRMIRLTSGGSSFRYSASAYANMGGKIGNNRQKDIRLHHLNRSDCYECLKNEERNYYSILVHSQ